MVLYEYYVLWYDWKYVCIRDKTRRKKKTQNSLQLHCYQPNTILLHVKWYVICEPHHNLYTNTHAMDVNQKNKRGICDTTKKKIPVKLRRKLSEYFLILFIFIVRQAFNTNPVYTHKYEVILWKKGFFLT